MYMYLLVSENMPTHETWILTEALNLCKAAAERHMRRVMIGVSWQDHRPNKWAMRKSKLCDIMHALKARKWTWAGHIARLQDNRWTSQVRDWRPMHVVDQ